MLKFGLTLITTLVVVSAMFVGFPDHGQIIANYVVLLLVIQLYGFGVAWFYEVRKTPRLSFFFRHMETINWVLNAFRLVALILLALLAVGSAFLPQNMVLALLWMLLFLLVGIFVMAIRELRREDPVSIDLPRLSWLVLHFTTLFLIAAVSVWWPVVSQIAAVSLLLLFYGFLGGMTLIWFDDFLGLDFPNGPVNRAVLDGILDLTETQIEDEDFITLARRLVRLRSDGIRITSSKWPTLTLPWLRGIDLGIERIYLNGTRITDSGLAVFFGHVPLRSLRQLCLRELNFGDVGLEILAERADHLIQLEQLDISGTAISSLGLNAFLQRAENLAQMRFLDLSATEIDDVALVSLAENSDHFGQLQHLDLSGTRIGDDGLLALAKQSDNLAMLQTLNLENTAVSLPEEVRKSTPEIIFEFVLHPERPLREVKLLLVGQGGVGKSHVCRRFFDNWTSPDIEFFDEQSESTHNVDMQTVKLSGVVPNAEPEPIDLNVWDFGGQNHLHGTHRFFLTAQRCIYVLVVDVTRPPNGDDDDTNRFNYWLRMLSHYGSDPLGNAPVILLLSQCDRCETTPSGDVLENYRKIKDTIEQTKALNWYETNVVAVIDGFGYGNAVRNLPLKQQQKIRKRHHRASEDLIQVIRSQISNVVGFDVPFTSGFFAVHEQVKAMFGDELPYFNYREHHEFVSECKAHNITDQQQQKYLTILHHLGAVHWVGCLPEIASGMNPEMHEVVFNPVWVKRPVYDLVQSPATTHEAGLVRRKTLNRLIPAPRDGNQFSEELYLRLPFRERDRENIISLMLACRVAFRVDRLPGIVDGILIPDLLRSLDSRELSDWENVENLAHVEWDFDFLSERLFFRLLAGHYHEVRVPKRDCHRNEAIFSLPNEDTKMCRVLVQTSISPSHGEMPRLRIFSSSASMEASKQAIKKILFDIQNIANAEELPTGQYPGIIQPSEEDDSVMKILFLAANPMDTSRLELDEEIRSLELELKGVTHRDRIQLVAIHAVRPDDMLRSVREHRPTVLHFSGHGSTAGIILKRDDGGSEAVAGDVLTQFLEGRGVEMVVLNSCLSVTQAIKIQQVVHTVVGTTARVEDKAARRFAVAFYRTLGNGFSIGEAFKDGQDALALHGFDDDFRSFGDVERIPVK